MQINVLIFFLTLWTLYKLYIHQTFDKNSNLFKISCKYHLQSTIIIGVVMLFKRKNDDWWLWTCLCLTEGFVLICAFQRHQEELPEAVSIIIDSDNSSPRKSKKDGSSALSASGSTTSVGDSSDDNFLQSQTPKQTRGNDNLSYLEKYKPLYLPADFVLLTTFGKRADKA